jgi:hypothetical protein
MFSKDAVLSCQHSLKRYSTALAEPGDAALHELQRCMQ